ncbi:hypothetical protein PHYBLDRAFT_172083 [Phycomyces blakesleeanus NRRL 1555(-)]|uniref:OTU domain-containing protein n=1 Tax=Phycomyces blakesleeanus (strain ATCC 8743b / DSM 1359 / FGSC 10004 / NBRC 33097 / NRRL 1555) TaxID=763407 RepID=A0A162NGR9_PHYB8|nr:hypothetical protein PHYBLDRAFT_172083 [Phycomyces blakesleeanus NRRL 1555(-)]OAD69444.1 hypothetical protein PHYBLDRAFT_172083 [Phycomyces blakesleeanus NRRL 1555(-)]|eukprot:XP_018287484.1 hypothetical protein PHYBLDRAFT_172083 [Phycomyces blakesleeanus NRRL 1555(-)]
MKDQKNWLNLYIYEEPHFGNYTSKLAKFNTIPNSCIPRPWRREYLREEHHLTINSPISVPPSIKEVSKERSEFIYDLKRIYEIYNNSKSPEEQAYIRAAIKNVVIQLTRHTLEDLNCPTIAKTVKDKPKKTKRKLNELEHCLEEEEAEEEKTVKKVGTKKPQKKINLLKKKLGLFSRKQLYSTQEQDALKDISLLGSPIDRSTFDNLTILPRHISDIFSPESDGNCGYRAVAMEVYQDQEKWPIVKDEMLKTFLKYRGTYYEGRMDNGNRLTSMDSLIISLQDKSSPLPDRHWFGIVDHPQLVADTFNRSVAIYWKTPRVTGDCLFVPLLTIPDKIEPMIIILADNHFLLAKRKNTRSYPWPPINPFHKSIVQRHKLEDFSVIQNSYYYFEKFNKYQSLVPAYLLYLAAYGTNLSQV